MSGIAWQLLNPVDTGSQVQQGFATGMAMVKQVQTKHALGNYIANPRDDQAYAALAYLDPESANSIQRQQMIRDKQAQEAAGIERRRAIGGMAASNPEAAREAALQGGDFDLAKTIGEMGDEQRKRTATFWTQAAPIAYKLRQISDPQQRQALWQEAKPILSAHAGDPTILEQFDPTNDTALDAVIATGQKIGDLIDQGKITWHQQGEQPSFATDAMGRPVGSGNPYANGGSVPPPPPGFQMIEDGGPTPRASGNFPG